MKIKVMRLLAALGVTFVSPGAFALEQAGFFELPLPTQMGTGSPFFSYNSAGATPTWFKPTGTTGVYEVTFANLGTSSSANGAGGDVQAVAHEPFKHCNPKSWGTSGTSLKVTVVCFDRFGNQSDTKFVTAFRRMVTPVDQPSGYLRAYLWSQFEGPSTSAPAFYSFNSMGGTNTVEWTGTGSYRVRLPQMVSGANGGTVMVSAYGTSGVSMRYCKVAGWFGSGVPGELEVDVNCFDSSGMPANSRFTLSYGLTSFDKVGSAAFAWADQPTAPSYTPDTFYQRDILSTNADPGNYSTTALSGTLTIDKTGTASYRVNVPNLNATGTTNVLVTSYGFEDSNFCWIDSW
ncbi:MAG TPA: hypothetical protein VF103_05705, partial [Polyangiaceae bacterium]